MPHTSKEAGTIRGMTKIFPAQPPWVTSALLIITSLLLPGTALAQATSGTGSGNSSGAAGSSGSTTSGTSGISVQQGQQLLYGASGSNGAQPNQSSYQGSVVQGRPTGTTIDLTLDDAIARGLRNNLGLILSTTDIGSSRGQRLQDLQQLLPTINGQASIEVEQVNLAAFGLKFPGLNPIIGPYQVVDFRAYLTQSVLNLQTIQNFIAAGHNVNAARLTAEDARGIVVYTVGNAYLICIADQARITAVEAELATARVTLDQAVASHDAGVSPRIDVLRAQVDYQNEEQTLISAKNQLDKDKISLARTIGLPLGQAFRVVTEVPYAPLNDVDAEQAFQQALKTRKNLASLEEKVRAGEASKKAATASQYPSANISGDYGDIGSTPGHSHGTFTATGEVRAPILQIAQTRGLEAVADAQYEQARAQLADQAQQVNADIRSSLLDIQAAAKLVQATRSNVDLANEALSEAQQRFRAGVSDNLPVSQAQAQSEQANDQYISALYQHNVAKLSLARAIGVAETNYKDYLGGK